MSDLIDRQAVIDLLKQMRKDGDMVPWEGKDVFARIRKLPTIQPEVLACGNGELVAKPEPTYEQVEEYCKRRCLHVVTADFFESTKPQRLGHWIPHETPDGDEQYECSECGVLWEFTDGTPEDNEAYFCPKCGAKMKGVGHESN